ncbi:MAG: peptidyl-prolyl cis-trans isomerase [Phycisphaeraceae bacterium]|nr:peptidyl-prolyl cis-trans isomerase [Phycisphaeraceae bacterium]
MDQFSESAPPPAGPRRSLAPRALFLVGAVTLACLVGCAGSAQRDPMSAMSQDTPPPPRPRTSGGSADADIRPAIVVNGQGVAWDDVWPALAEHSGGAIVAEVVLDTLLQADLARRGLSISPRDIEHERQALTRTIVEGVSVSDQQAQILARRVADARALGPHRMEALLRRNAMLRAIARESVAPTEDALRRAYDIEHGRRFVTRLITLPDHRAASDLERSLRAGDPASLRARFAEAAVARSTDPTGAAGGLLGPISPADSSLPAALRQSVATMTPGSMTPIIALDTGFALAYVESVIEPDAVAFESVRPALEQRVRERMERIEMDVIAREMLASARVSVLDRSLDWGWQTGRSR